MVPEPEVLALLVLVQLAGKHGVPDLGCQSGLWASVNSRLHRSHELCQLSAYVIENKMQRKSEQDMRYSKPQIKIIDLDYKHIPYQWIAHVSSPAISVRPLT